MEDGWLQQDGEPSHFVPLVYVKLKEHFLGCWIGCVSLKSPVPLSWLPYSPHLTTRNNTSWGNIKEQVGVHHYGSDDSSRLSNLLLPFQYEYFRACHKRHGSASGYVQNTITHKQMYLMYSTCHQMVREVKENRSVVTSSPLHLSSS
jgi:hypothetical protein